jgi:DNA-binding NtrC family response regulator
MQPRMNFPTVPLSEVPPYATFRSGERARPTILVVDDEHVIADTLAQIFNRNGYSASAAYGAAAALEIVALSPPNLLITDVVMPGMSGIELAITMERICPECQVILFSGQASTVDLLASARASGYAFQTLTKPVHPSVMLARVAELLPARADAAQD